MADPPSEGKERMLKAAKLLRKALPGDPELGEPQTTRGNDPEDALARRLAEKHDEKPSVMRELGLGALQAWQALSEAQGRGRGDVDVAILFTDLVDFSSWALQAGDEKVLELVREVEWVLEPAVADRGGDVVKMLGDGMMAVFSDSVDAVGAAHACAHGVAELELGGYRPQLRAGVHLGRPRRVRGDYLGVDVNIAARVCDAATGGEVLVSGSTRERLPEARYKLRKRRWFKAKGAPKDLEVYAAEPTQP